MKIGGVYADISANVTKFNSAFKSASSSVANFGKQADTTSARMRGYQDRIRAMERQKQLLAERVKKLSIDYNKNEFAIKGLQNSMQNLSDRQATVRTRMTELGSASKKTAWFMSPGYFKTHLLANALGNVLGRAIVNVTGWLRNMAGQAITSGREFQKMSALMAASGNFSTDTTEKLNQAIFKLGRETNFTATEVQEAFRMYQKNGGDVQVAMEGLMESTLQYAQITKSDLASAIDLVTDIQLVYGKKLSENFDLTQLLVGGNEEAKWSTEGYRDALIEILPNANKFTDSIEDMNALIPLTASYFSSASEQGTGLRRMLSEIANPKKWENFEAIGVDVLNAEGNMRSFKDIITDTTKQLAGKSFEEVQTFYGGFDERARRGIEATVNEFDRLDKTVSNISKYDVGGMFDATMSGTDRLSATLDTLGIEFMRLEIGGHTLGDVIDRAQGKMADIAQAVFNQLQPALNSLQPFFNWIINNKEMVIGALSGIALVMGVALIPTLITGAVAVWAFLSPFLLLAGIGVVIGLALWGLYEAFSWMWGENFLGIRTYFTLLWQEMQNIWGIIVAQVKPALMELWTEFKNLWTAIQPILAQHLPMLKQLFMDVLVFTIKNIIIPTLKNFRDFFMAVLPHAINILKISIDFITGVIRTWANFIKENSETIKNIFRNMVDFVRNILQGDFKGAFEDAKNIIKSIGDLDLIQLGKDLMQGLINGITGMSGAVWDAVTNIASSVADGFKDAMGINSPSKLFEGFGEDTVEGYEIGLDKQINLGALAMMPSVGETLSSVDNSSQTSNNTQNVTFNISGAQNPNNIVKEVMSQLERLNINARKGMSQNYA